MRHSNWRYNNSMKEEKYNIKDLEKLSGIKAHTIRIWEKRYALLEPKRTQTNIRYYTGDDLKKLLNISLLNKNGIKISRISELSIDELNEKVIELTSRNSDVEDQIQALTMSMFYLNTAKFEKLLTISYINRGFENTFTEIITPFLVKIGFLWQAGTITPAQEHFATNIIRQKLLVAIDGLLPNQNKKSKSYILFLPEDELHELGLLFAYYNLKKQNQLVTYLGANVPLSSIDEINSTHQSDYIVTSFTSYYSGAKTKEYLDKLSEKFLKQTILIFGALLDNYNEPFPHNVKKIKNATEIQMLIEETTSVF